MKVISWTPAGRTKFLKVLVKNVLNNKHLLSKHLFFLNTSNVDDLNYIHQVCGRYPDFFFAIPIPPARDKVSGICSCYAYLTDLDVLYLRLDDDLCFIDENCISNMVNRFESFDGLLVFPFIINNAICSFLLQHHGIIEFNQIISYNWRDETAWEQCLFAEKLHKQFLDHPSLLIDKINQLKDWLVLPGERFSVNCFLTSGRKIRDLLDGGIVEDGREEIFLTDYSKKKGFCSLVHPLAVVSHFAFWKQRSLPDELLLNYFQLQSPKMI